MRRRFLLSVLASDLVALTLGLVVASVTVFDTWLPWQARENVWPMMGLAVGGLLLGSYASLRMWAQGAPRPSYGRALAIVSTSGVVAAVGIVITRGYWSRAYMGIALGTALLLALAHRGLRRRRPWSESLVLVTSEKGLADDLHNADHADVVALYDPSGEPPINLEPTVTLVVDLRPVMSDRMAQYVSSWNLAGYPVRALSTLYEEHTGRLPMVHLAEGWELTAPVSRNEYAPLKRGIDLVLTLVTLPLWVLFSAAIWVAVKFDSPGPAIYKQRRVGLHGETFTLYKFRTMVLDAEKDGPRFATHNDTRLTRIGRWLRLSRLDELPQLWNVLKGDVSLVGPRPERPEFTDYYERSIPFYAYRHLIRPGVTGWAQVNYGYADDDADTIEKLTYDLYYLKHMSPWLDLQILGRSIWTMLSGFGAR
ncbi:MAG: exopolysaccharide biosynthesis polyprenyl glycosylphosphotransferase [Acidimicrobiia bacterium]|nr:exopolysaccharide biosynthesis polyprenyl glycosylphosphotransferase [Acidimicrobiia bacterium]